MPIHDWLPRRWKREADEMPRAIQHKNLPLKLRKQICLIGHNCLGEFVHNPGYSYHQPEEIYDAYKRIVEKIKHEEGVFTLEELFGKEYKNGTELNESLWNAVLCVQDIPTVLGIIEVIFQEIGSLRFQRPVSYYYENKNNLADAISDLNTRFRQSDIGYQFQNNQIIRIDSEYLHQESMIPAMALLRDSQYEIANDEFMSAHLHYKRGEFDDCVIDCGRAFESTLKVICHKRNWMYNQNDVATRLIDTVISNGLIPSYWKNQLLGIPTSRNKVAHGGGTQVIRHDIISASFVLHLTASNIVFLVESENTLR